MLEFCILLFKIEFKKFISLIYNDIIIRILVMRPLIIKPQLKDHIFFVFKL